MLSRVADSAFWMSRYVERAESVARLVDVNLQLMLDLPSERAREVTGRWPLLVQCLGDDGSFTVRKRKARMGRNPQTGERIKIKASKTVAFKAGKGLKDLVG